MGITGPACFGFERSWLSKALRHIPNRPDLFAEDAIDDAQYLLGLGNRQVLALGYWLRNLGLAEKDKAGQYRLSDLGTVIHQYDPQVEELGTWFTLHYMLSARKEAASTYWYVANRMSERVLRDQLTEGLQAEFPGKSTRTYQDAVSVFLAILSKTPIGTLVFALADDTVFKVANPSQLPDAVLLFALLHWCQTRGRTGLSLIELSTEGAPGRIFGLTEAALRAFLDRTQDRYAKRALWWSQTSGLDSITTEEGLPSLAMLRSYYLEHLDGLSPLEALNRGIKDEAMGGAGSGQ